MFQSFDYLKLGKSLVLKVSAFIYSPVGLYQGDVNMASVSTNVSLHLCVPCVLLKDKCSIKFYKVNVSLERRMPHEHHRRQYQV